MTLLSSLKPEDRPGFASDDPTVNRVELVGYLGQAPEVRYTPMLEPVVTFTVATHRIVRDEREDVTQLTDWHRIVAMGELAGPAQELRQGALVKVVGRLRTRSWETRRGERRIRTEVIASEVRQVRRAPSIRQVPLPLT